MTKEYRITYNDVVLHATRQPSGRMTLHYNGSDSHVIDFVNRINRVESTFADVASELDAMMTIYVPTRRKSQNLGHGEGSAVFNVWSEQGVYGERRHPPIFTTRQSCKEWIAGQDKYSHYTITEAELLP